MPVRFPTPAFHNPHCPGLSKSPQPCCPPPPRDSQLDRPLTGCSLLCPRALLYLPHLNQEIPLPPVSSSHLCLPGSFPVPLPIPAAGCTPAPSPFPWVQPPRCRPQSTTPCTVAATWKVGDFTLETDYGPSETGRQSFLSVFSSSCAAGGKAAHVTRVCACMDWGEGGGLLLGEM